MLKQLKDDGDFVHGYSRSFWNTPDWNPVNSCNRLALKKNSIYNPAPEHTMRANKREAHVNMKTFIQRRKKEKEKKQQQNQVGADNLTVYKRRDITLK